MRKRIGIALLLILTVAFCTTEITLIYFLPLARTDFDVWLDYFGKKDAVYDAMFLFYSLLIFWNIQNRWGKSISAFLVVVTGGSFIDKVVFSLNQHLTSDIVLILLGLVFMVVTYRRYGRV
jgi:hypothetical protein